MNQSKVADLANDYIADMFSNSELSYDEFLDEQRAFYRKNASHLSDCFVDTAHWIEGEGVTQDELEKEIVRQIMDGQEW